MARPEGLPKTGGRRKGTPNKKTQFLSSFISQLKFNVPEQLLQLLPQLCPEKRADVLLALLPYMFPKPKASEQVIETTQHVVKELTEEEIDREWNKIRDFDEENTRPI